MTRKAGRQLARSGKQKCPVCNEKRLLVLHHINGREIPDWNAAWNEVYICATCHDSVHSGRTKINGYIATTSGVVLDFYEVSQSKPEGRASPFMT